MFNSGISSADYHAGYLQYGDVKIVLYVAGAAVAASIFYIAYSLMLHPLANLPGPRLAALTNWWAIYYELKGILPWKVESLRKQHKWTGVIRVGPNRVAVQQPSQFEVIYKVGSKFMKEPWLYRNFPSASDGATTTSAIDKTWHANRRKATMGKLSRQKVGELHFLVAEKLDLLMKRVQEMVKSGKRINIFGAWRSMTLDIISSFAFGTSLNSLADPELDHFMLDTMEHALGCFYLASDLHRVRYAHTLTSSIVCSNTFGPATSEQSVDKLDLPGSEGDVYLQINENGRFLTTTQVQTEAEDILIAGSDTTATTLTYACVNLARKPEMWERLYQEIKPVYGDSKVIPSGNVLEPLPFLTACLRESLRLASPVPAYLWRIVPDGGYVVDTADGQISLPAGTSVGMSQIAVHYDAELYPEPASFNPHRWLTSEGGLRGDYEKYLVPFSKGTRQCGGINLAWLELYLALATIVMRFRVKSFVGEKGMGQTEYFVGILESNKYEILYEPRHDE